MSDWARRPPASVTEGTLLVFEEEVCRYSRVGSVPARLVVAVRLLISGQAREMCWLPAVSLVESKSSAVTAPRMDAEEARSESAAWGWPAREIATSADIEADAEETVTWVLPRRRV